MLIKMYSIRILLFFPGLSTNCKMKCEISNNKKILIFKLIVCLGYVFLYVSCLFSLRSMIWVDNKSLLEYWKEKNLSK